jgi:hypothetical protein
LPASTGGNQAHDAPDVRTGIGKARFDKQAQAMCLRWLKKIQDEISSGTPSFELDHYRTFST